MKTITRQTTATTEKGTVLNLTVTATRGWEKVKETIFSDGWNTEVEKMKEINETNIAIEVNGQVFDGSFRILQGAEKAHYNNQVHASFAGKIGASEIVYNQLNSCISEAKKEAETDENWIALQAQKEQSRKEELEYYRHSNAVENMMTLNGRTY